MMEDEAKDRSQKLEAWTCEKKEVVVGGSLEKSREE